MTIELKGVFDVGNQVKLALLEPETKFFNAQLDQFVTRNNELARRTSRCGFMFGGKFYHHSSQTYRAATSNGIHSLHRELDSEFSEILNQKKKAELEVQQIWQCLLPLFNFHSGVSYRDALPDELAIHVDGLGHKPRVMPFETVLSFLNPEKRAAYENILPRMRLYLSLRMAI